MSRIIAAVVLCLALTGEVAAQATATGTATATGVGGIQQMEQTGGTQTNQQLMQGDNVNVAAQPVVTPLYPSPLPGTPLNTGGGLPAFVRNVLGHLGNRAVCGSKTYRTFRGELIAVAGKSGKTVIVFTKFAEQQERESQKPNLLLNAIAPAKFTTTPLKNRACVGSLFVVSLAGNKPDGGTVDDDIDEALFSAVRGVDEVEKVTVPQTFGGAQTFVVDASSFNLGAGGGGIWGVIAKVLNIGYTEGKAGRKVKTEVGYTPR